jgi:hypothetical protein
LSLSPLSPAARILLFEGERRLRRQAPDPSRAAWKARHRRGPTAPIEAVQAHGLSLALLN